jgi:hypothetical protein
MGDYDICSTKTPTTPNMIKPAAKPPPPPPPPVANPPTRTTYAAQEYAHTINKFINENGKNIDNLIKEVEDFLPTCKHTKGECYHYWEKTLDEKSIIGMNNYKTRLDNYQNNLKDYFSYKDTILRDTVRCTIELSIQKRYYERELPVFHKTQELDPLDKEIAAFNKQIPEVQANKKFIETELNNFQYFDYSYINTLNSHVDVVNDQNRRFARQDSGNKKFLFDGIRTENEILSNKTQDLDTFSASNKRESQFLSETTSWITYGNSILFYLYYIILVGLIYVFFGINKSINFYVKIVVIITFLIYPFIIGYITTYLTYIFTVLVSFITIKVHKDPGDKYSTSHKHK